MALSIRVLLAGWITLFPLLSSLVAAEGRKLAVVIGVNTYRQNSGLPALGQAASDAQRLSGALRKTGFTVYEMTHEVAKQDGKEALAPNLDYIRDQINGVLDFPNLGEDDAVIITLHGHGVQFDLVDYDGKKTPQFYFCPADAKIQEIKTDGTVEPITTANQLTDRNHLLPLEELYTELGKCHAGTKLLIVDACRNDPTQPGPFRTGVASGTLPKLAPPPGGTAAFFSCKPNQMAVEDKALGQGVFTHFLVQGLEGQADQPLAGKPADGIITFSELTTYVANNTYSYVFDKHNGLKQSPEMRGEFDLNLPLAKVSLKVLTNTIGMQLTLIPSGEFLMGSPASEAVRQDEEGPQHRVRITKPFYLGVHEVTKGQFAAFVKAKNFRTDAEKDGKGGYGLNAQGVFEQKPEYTWKNNGFPQTDDHPVVNVSWNDAVAFCEWLSAKEGKTYQLPSEAQWEYACRAGTTTPFHFGAINDGKKANIDGNYPYGTETKGPYLERTARVGSYSANEWGLSDMHGNVREWCFDEYAEQLAGGRDPLNISTVDRRVLRGGSWDDFAWDSRSANRFRYAPVFRFNNSGFRVSRTQ